MLVDLLLSTLVFQTSRILLQLLAHPIGQVVLKGHEVGGIAE